MHKSHTVLELNFYGKSQKPTWASSDKLRLYCRASRGMIKKTPREIQKP